MWLGVCNRPTSFRKPARLTHDASSFAHAENIVEPLPQFHSAGQNRVTFHVPDELHGKMVAGREAEGLSLPISIPSAEPCVSTVDIASAAVCIALAHPVRIAMLRLLAEQEINVNDLASLLGISQSATSQHLSRLRNQNLVVSRRSGTTIFYECSVLNMRGVLEMLDGLQK